MKKAIFTALTLLLAVCFAAQCFGKEIDGMTFLHKKEAVSAPITAPASDQNTFSVIIEDTQLETLQNISKRSHISAYSINGNRFSLQIITKPQKGEVSIEGAHFTYQPYKDMVGFDSFVVQAIDEFGAISREATVSIEIEAVEYSFSYTDMAGNPSAYAANKLYQAGVYTGKQIGGEFFFQPNHTMTRGDFLVLTVSAVGLSEQLSPTVNTGLPNDHEFPAWLKPYIATALQYGILAEGAPFQHSEIPTRAEAVILTDAAAGIADVKEYTIQAADTGDIPDWALKSYRDLAAYRMLDLHDGYARPQYALTNSYAADLAWQLYKHCHH